MTFYRDRVPCKILGKTFQFENGTKVVMKPSLKKKGDNGYLQPDFVVYDDKEDIVFILDVKTSMKEGGKRMEKYQQFVSDKSKIHVISSNFENAIYFKDILLNTDRSRSTRFYDSCLTLLDLEFSYWESCRALGYIVGNNRGVREATEFRFSLLYKEVEYIHQRMENLGLLLDKLDNLEKQVRNLLIKVHKFKIFLE